MSHGPLVEIPVVGSHDVIVSRREARNAAQRMGFSRVDQTRLATAVSEITRNVLQHAGTDGVCRIAEYVESGRAHVDVQICDTGGGIADLDRAMADGFTTGRGLGAGLPGAKRLVSSFDVVTGSGGTTVKLGVSRHSPL